ncbi:hypothetical protein [Prochlorothrix hollandica]
MILPSVGEADGLAMAEAICQHIRALGIDHRQSQLSAKVVTVSGGEPV